MGMSDKDQETTAIVLVSLGAITNLLLVCALAHTWRHWRQVRWYIVLLTAGNIVEVAFTIGSYLHGTMAGGWPEAGHACKFLVFMATLGRDLPAMALAALAVHVLLTAITGSQGDRLRHLVVLALFLILSLPMPIAQIPLFDVKTFSMGDRQVSVCTSNVESEEQRLFYQTGLALASTFFPLAVIIAACTASLVLNCRANRAETKKDVSASDLVLASILGMVLAVCDIPVNAIELHIVDRPYSLDLSMIDTHRHLAFFSFSRPIMAAVVCVIFGYVHAFRNRGEGYAPMDGNQARSGERQRLVN